MKTKQLSINDLYDLIPSHLLSFQTIWMSHSSDYIFIMSEQQSVSVNIQQEEVREGNSNSQLGSKKRLHRKQEISNFIMKTYRILQEKKNSHIIEWTEGGVCFIVKNKELFQNQILPKYFKHRKFSSFVRQLNMYDFHKIRKEKEIPIFKHKFFRMGCFQLLHKIKRKSGFDGKDEDGLRNIHSLPDIQPSAPEPARSYSQKPRTVQHPSEEIEQLIAENAELKSSISELNKETMQLELSKVKKQEKLVKILSALTYFDIGKPLDNHEENYSLRDLQNHFIGEDEPLSFLQYARKLGFLYRDVFKRCIQ